MNLTKLDKKYVSEIDKFLLEFDAQHPEKSASQVREIQKAARIKQSMNPSSAPRAPSPAAGRGKEILWKEF